MEIYRITRELTREEEYRNDTEGDYLIILDKSKDDVYGILTKQNIEPFFIQDVVQEDVIKYESIDELKILTLALNVLDIQTNNLISHQFSVILNKNTLICIVDNVSRDYISKILKIFNIRKVYTFEFFIYLVLHGILTDNIMILDYLEGKYLTHERNLSSLSNSAELDQKEIMNIFDIKDTLSVLKRQSLLYRELLLGIKTDIFNQDTKVYYEDLVDRLNMFTKDLDIFNDRLQNFITQTLLIMNFSAAEATKLLSAISAIFLPMSVIASIYGMNFDNMPELQHPLGYYFALLMIITSGILSFYIMKRKRYI
ncbi:MAG: hypothetical protein NZ908_02105 [Candidatus Micrarchaeota archaeon]|nr:hypothetical protein [Candidatus Micrarchaeota archaeon]MCX8154313.1 hypothetical protein [Candidatus Micrarchaeota archaeon]